MRLLKALERPNNASSKRFFEESSSKRKRFSFLIAMMLFIWRVFGQSVVCFAPSYFGFGLWSSCLMQRSFFLGRFMHVLAFSCCLSRIISYFCNDAYFVWLTTSCCCFFSCLRMRSFNVHCFSVYLLTLAVSFIFLFSFRLTLFDFLCVLMRFWRSCLAFFSFLSFVVSSCPCF